MEFRLQLRERTIILKAQSPAEFCGLVKTVSLMDRIMGVTAEGDDLATHFLVELQELRVRMGEIHTPVERPGIDLYAFSVIQDPAEDRLEQIPVITDLIILRLCGAVSYNIVQMSVDIVVFKMFHGIEDLFKVPAISAGLAPFFKVSRVVGIKSVHHVGRADDEIKTGIAGGEIGHSLAGGGHKSLFDPDLQIKVGSKFLLQGLKCGKIPVKVQIKAAFGNSLREIMIIMIRDTDLVHSFRPGGSDHIPYGSFAVTGEFGMKMVVWIHSCPFPVFRRLGVPV